MCVNLKAEFTSCSSKIVLWRNLKRLLRTILMKNVFNFFQWLILLVKLFISVNNNLCYTEELFVTKNYSFYAVFFSNARYFNVILGNKKYDSVHCNFYNFTFSTSFPTNISTSFSPLVLFVIISCPRINVVNEKHFQEMFPLCIGSTGYCEGNSTSLLVKLPRQLLFLYETRSVLLVASMVDPIF